MAEAAEPTRRDERWPRAARLARPGDFTRCYGRGRRRQARAFVLHWIDNGGPQPRLGVTASRKVGDAVMRHHLKRWTREVFRRSPLRPQLPACDFVVHFKPGAVGELQFAEFERELTLGLAAAAAAGKRA